MDSIINGKTENQKVHTITNVNKKKQKKYHQKLYGNYDNYYFKRYGAENSSDIRVELLKKHSEYFNGKRILDIGCNSGFVTIEMAKQFQTSSILGIDIDENLIEKARKNLNRIKNDSMLNEDEKKSLSNIIFRKANYILQNQQLLEHEKEEFDAILCLSITKWIHLNHGDNGIEFLFKRIFKQLRSGGILVLEAQAYETYKKRSKLSPQILENYRNIKLKPDKFESYLMSEKIGFSETWRVADGKDLKNTVKAKGFCRTLQIFIKS